MTWQMCERYDAFTLWQTYDAEGRRCYVRTTDDTNGNPIEPTGQLEAVHYSKAAADAYPPPRLRSINACCNRLADVVTDDLAPLFPLTHDEAEYLADAVRVAARDYLAQ